MATDKNLVEALADPLVHLVRNSVDHGVELPDVREQKGKPREGTVTLAATQEGDHILLSIEDDGAGMDPELLRRKVVEKGYVDMVIHLLKSEDPRSRHNGVLAITGMFKGGSLTPEQITDEYHSVL